MLMKADVFQGKSMVKDWWSEMEYVVVHQVTHDIPAYEGCDDGKSIKIIHHNQLSLVATLWGEAMPLGASKSLSEEGTSELSPLEWESKAPESNMDEAATLCLTSHVLLGLVDNVLWLLPSVAPRSTLRGLGAYDGMWGLSDEEVH